jgi:spermidine/putrescine-binding protein
VRHRSVRARWLIAVLTALALVVADFTSHHDSDESSTEDSTGGGSGEAASAESCDGATLSFIGLEGEEGQAELEDWRADAGVELDSSWPGDWAQMISALRVGQTYDLGTVPYHQAQRMIAADVLQPIDTDRLENWDSLVAGLADAESLRGPDGEVYGVPIAWGDGPYVYNPETVSEDELPSSIEDLLAPEWEGRFVLNDSPDLPFYLFALANGFDAPNLTPEEVEIVAEQSAELVENAGAFTPSYEDATERLVSGDTDLALGGWEAMLTWAEEDGVTLDYAFFDEGSFGWWDGMGIPTTADDVDCAYAYIDALIAPEANAELATNLVSGAVNEESIDLVGEEAQIYDYSLVQEELADGAFASVTPPEEPEDGIASYQDWLDAWQEVKAG